MDQWDCHTHGSYVLDVERKVMAGVLQNYFGYHVVQVGGPTREHYLTESRIRHKIRVSSDRCDSFEGDNVQADPYLLPFTPHSIDLFVLPHVLEYLAHPEQMLKSCFDALVGGGHIIILSFNPYSLMGLAKSIGKNDRVFRRAQFITPMMMRKYLNQAGFYPEEYKSMCFRIPLKSQKWFERLKVMEPVGRFISPSNGGVYMMIAEKKMVSMNVITPERNNGSVNVPNGVVEPSASKITMKERK